MLKKLKLEIEVDKLKRRTRSCGITNMKVLKYSSATLCTELDPIMSAINIWQKLHHQHPLYDRKEKTSRRYNGYGNLLEKGEN